MLRTAARGYERRAVDAVLARCAASLRERAAEFPELAGLPPAPDGSPPLDAADVRDLRFPVVRRGYDTAQVDALLARVAAALPGEDARPDWEDEAPPPPADGPEAALTTVHLSVRGYDRHEVEDFLVRCAHTLGERVSEVPELAPLQARPRTGRPVRARDVETVQFSVRLRGYAVDEVDALLDRVAAALTR